ncbi:MAG: hypothetical protein PHV30_06960 [Candidatus Margulisbacteria bacterium]|nr:hypothetical protein [Candidatus Margulisiibacteriota bacterium]
MSVREQENKIFKEWGKLLGHDNYGEDGIVNEKLYFKSRIKTIFILKELVNDPIDLREFLNEGAIGRHQTWNNVTRWLIGIRNISNPEFNVWHERLDEITEETRKEYLQSIGVINLKKEPGMNSTSDNKLYQYLKEYNESKRLLLSQQYNLYKPDLVIFGLGRGKVATIASDILFGSHDNWKRCEKTDVFFLPLGQNKYAIDYFHPQPRMESMSLRKKRYEDLIITIKEIFGDNSKK